MEKVKLRFKESHPILPDNYQLSTTRLESLLRWLKSKQKVLKHYDEVIQEQLEKGIIEPCSEQGRTKSDRQGPLPATQRGHQT